MSALAAGVAAHEPLPVRLVTRHVRSGGQGIRFCSVVIKAHPEGAARVRQVGEIDFYFIDFSRFSTIEEFEKEAKRFCNDLPGLGTRIFSQKRGARGGLVLKEDVIGAAFQAQQHPLVGTRPTHLLYVGNVSVSENYKGQNFGLTAIAELVRQYGFGCAAVLLSPQPIGYRGLASAVAAQKLIGHYSKLGFKPLTVKEQHTDTWHGYLALEFSSLWSSTAARLCAFDGVSAHGERARSATNRSGAVASLCGSLNGGQVTAGDMRRKGATVSKRIIQGGQRAASESTKFSRGTVVKLRTGASAGGRNERVSALAIARKRKSKKKKTNRGA